MLKPRRLGRYWPALVMVLVLALASLGAARWQGWPWSPSLTGQPQAPLPPLQAWRDRPVPCSVLYSGPAERPPLLLLAMGQSNAANHAQALAPTLPLPLIDGERCGLSTDPLPGATGAGASLWSAVHAQLGGQLGGRPVVWAVMAVDGSSLAQWLGPGPLRQHWEQRLAALLAQTQRLGWPVAAVLWQQGEADARAGRSAADYAADLRRLQQAMARHGLSAPWWLAQSGRCPPAGGVALQAAREQLWQEAPQTFRRGPDTDQLGPALREGCHFNAHGREAAAGLWVLRLRSQSW